MELKVFYRISDKGRPKPKLDIASKFGCFENAIKEFGKENFVVIADNCNKETIDYFKQNKIVYEETSLGNCGSFQYMCKKIFETLSDDQYIYLLEDDYIHLPNSRKKIEEGLMIADYVTLYDHPDKYDILDTEHKTANPLNYKSLRKVSLYRTNSSHWRETNSTTMTFATKVGILKEDYLVWEKYTTNRNVPFDFAGFLTLTEKSFSAFRTLYKAKHKLEARIIFKNWLKKRKTRLLISAVPASSTHAELAFLAPVIDWKSIKN